MFPARNPDKIMLNKGNEGVFFGGIRAFGSSFWVLGFCFRGSSFSLQPCEYIVV